MVAAMGGENSKDFDLFKQLCVEAYNILRKNANLILNLVSLMIDANIPDVGNERCILQVCEFVMSDYRLPKLSDYFISYLLLHLFRFKTSFNWIKRMKKLGKRCRN